MREIKFRVWDKKNEEMIHLENSGLQYFDFEGNYSLGFTVAGYSGFWAHEQYERPTREAQYFPIMQYIELKDKNGKEIYEGDILHCQFGECHQYTYEYDFKFAVIFSNGLFGGNHKDGYRIEFGEIDNYEIIGNIYETPELLEK